MELSEALSAFSALSQPTRLDVFRLLIKAGAGGLLSGEIGEKLDVRQNTMSANLTVLLNAGLVRNERQGRSIRYFADFEAMRGLLGFLMEDCCGGRPDLCQPVIDQIAYSSTHPGEKFVSDTTYNVLFLCTGNSARSILAEAIMNRVGQGRFMAYSAGSQPKGEVHPQSIALLKRLNFDTGFARSKNWEEFATPDAPKLDFVFTVCDNAAGEACPVWPGQPMTAHWGVPDPAAVEGTETEIALAFSDTYRMLNSRISIFTSLPLSSIDRLSLQERLDEIGTGERVTS